VEFEFDETMDLARHIAEMDAFALRQAKRAGQMKEHLKSQ
jgi:hypothetical protein